MNKDTSIRIKKPTRDKLAKFCSKNQSYDNFINMLLQDYEKSITKDNYK